ncbi:MAG: hypothetical protein V1800_05875 [Candidatus Latescibacterota bacterium]
MRPWEGCFPGISTSPPYRHTTGYQGPIVEPELIEAITYREMSQGFNGINYYIFVDGQHADHGA